MIKILIVDDEPDVESLFLQSFRRQIKSKQWQFIFCANGKEALDVLEKHPDIELALTDINMPVMDGLAFLKEIKERKIQTKAVIISAYGDMKNIRTAMNRGAFDFITKPMNFEDVSATILKTLQYIQQMKKAEEDKRKLFSLRKELEVAKTVQESILPAPAPSELKCRISARIIPAKEVGGDFYDFFSIDEDHFALVVADVSGKGISSAIFAVVSQTLVKSMSGSFLSPKECVESVNRSCSKNNDNCMFVTLFYGLINFKTNSLTYANAGHNPPYKINAGGQALPLESLGDPPLGVHLDRSFQERRIEFSPGEALFLYTDGITEARNKKKEFFGESRLEELLSKNSKAPIEKAGAEVLKSVREFAGGEDQSDDITYLFCQYKK